MLAGCGTITRGSSEEVAINAKPEGTKIATSTGEQCETSCVLDVPRKQEFTVTASKAGYQTEVVEVRTKVSGGGATSMAGNVLIGGVVGVGIDAANGSMLDHYPNPVNIELEPDGVPQIPVVTEPGETTASSQVPTS
ncbi:translation initiation factor 2 [Jiella marina]|uniref:translation initiation factor 2 n=1 Tax=Jiella sp. LLJ827 TaxID=2917712 RepID=UPI002100A1B2|nr:translation initiation factor 2 [Jiella sp. LLJ827]MCQ0989664.1 translation initiation factor 2 [Jiella sp. LLJ827]